MKLCHEDLVAVNLSGVPGTKHVEPIGEKVLSRPPLEVGPFPSPARSVLRLEATLFYIAQPKKAMRRSSKNYSQLVRRKRSRTTTARASEGASCGHEAAGIRSNVVV